MFEVKPNESVVFDTAFKRTISYTDGRPPNVYSESYKNSFVFSPGFRSGGQNPKWRDQIGRASATTGFSAMERSVKYQPMHLQYYYKQADNSIVTASMDSVIQPTPAFGTLPGADAVNKARSIAAGIWYNKARSAQTQIDGGVFLGELNEVIRMVRNPAAGLQNLMSKDWPRFLRGRDGIIRGSGPRTGAGLKRIVSPAARRDIAGLWLEMVFGWLPFVNDINSGVAAYEAFLDSNKSKSKAITAVGTDEVTDTPTFSITSLPGLADSKYIIEMRGTLTASVLIKGEVKTEGVSAARSPMGRFNQHFGLDLSNFANTVWNLTPNSFIADYFSNLGDIVNAASFQRSTIIWSMMVVKKTVRNSYTGLNGTRTLGASITGNYGAVVTTYKTVDRTEIIAPPMPHVVLHTPKPMQMGNLAALLAAR